VAVKHAVLTSIGHNIADSLASGCGLLIGVYVVDVFGEAAQSNAGFIEVDFLTGKVSGGPASSSLSRAINLYAEALSALCQRQGAEVADFVSLTARYWGAGADRCFTVEVTDRNGKTSRDQYLGSPGARPRTLDPLGRLRRTNSA
jgi:hypothetical protein